MNRLGRYETVGFSSRHGADGAAASPDRDERTRHVVLTANAEMGSATSRNGPGRRHNVRLSAPGGASMIVAGGISETAAGRLAEALNDFLAAALAGSPPISLRCQHCASEISPAIQGRPPSYCSGACRAAAYRRRRQANQNLTVVDIIPDAQPRRPITVYECDTCGTRTLGHQYCSDCCTFMRRVGIGGCCPNCDEPIATAELLTPP